MAAEGHAGEPADARDEQQTLRRNTAAAFGVQVATAAFTAVLTLALIRLLGAHSYGLFALAMAVAGLVLLPADLGISVATARYLAEAAGDRERARVTVAAGMRLKLVVGVAVGAGLVLLAAPIADAYGVPALVWPLRAMAIAVFGQSMMRFCLTGFASQQRSSLTLVVVSVESFFETAASIAIVALGGGAAGAAFGRAIGYAVGAMLGVVVLFRLLGVSPLDVIRRPAESGLARRIVGYGSAVVVVDAVWALFTQVDVLLIGALLTATDAGVFQAPVRLLALVSYPGVALGVAVGPRLARREDRPPDVASLIAATELLLIVQAFAAAVALAWAQPLAGTVLGSGYAESGTVLAVLAPYILLSGLAPLFSNAIDYLGATVRRIALGVAAVTVNVVIDLLLLRRIGVVAAAIATDVAYAAYVAGHVAVGARLLRFPVRRLARAFAGSLTGMAAAAGLLVACRSLGTAGYVVGVPIAFGGFAAVVRATGAARTRPWRSFGLSLPGRREFRPPAPGIAPGLVEMDANGAVDANGAGTGEPARGRRRRERRQSVEAR